MATDDARLAAILQRWHDDQEVMKAAGYSVIRSKRADWLVSFAPKQVSDLPSNVSPFKRPKSQPAPEPIAAAAA